MLRIPESCAVWCGTHDLWSSPKGNNRRDSGPVNMVARTSHTRSTLEIGSTGHGCQTHHAGRRRWHPLYVDMHHSAGKTLCPRALNDRNCLILQLLQIPLACYDAIHRDRFSKPLLSDYTSHGIFCRMERRLRNSVWIFIGPEPRVLLVHESILREGNGLYHWITGSLKWRVSTGQTLRSYNKTHVSAAWW